MRINLKHALSIAALGLVGTMLVPTAAHADDINNPKDGDHFTFCDQSGCDNFMYHCWPDGTCSFVIVDGVGGIGG